MSKEITISLDEYEKLKEIEQVQYVAYKILEVLNKENRKLTGEELYKPLT